MKRVLFSCFILFGMIGSSVAQDFAPIGSKWYYDSVDSGQAPYHSEYFLYESVKDTLVASTTCKKITVSKFEYDGNVHLYPSLFVYGDTNEVFYYSSQFEKFCSLYKFNVSIGDTIEYCTLPSVFVIDSIFKVKVDTILYQTISNRNVKFIYTEPLSTSNGYSFSFWGSYSWYIGCLNMMLPQQTPNIPERDGPLRCYEDSDKTFSFNNDWPLACDFTITGIGDVNSSDNLISISPNPVISQLLFETKLTSEMNIELISSLGNIVRRFSFKNSASIDVGDLPSGLYFIQLLSDKNSLVYSEKIVKF